MTARINHWIGGVSTPGSSTRTAPVHNPATGECTAEVLLADAGRRRRRGRRREAGRRGVAARLAVPARRRSCSRSASCSTGTPTSSPRSSPPSTARCSPTPRARWPAGLENVEFATGVPHLLKGGFSEQAATGVDVLLDPPAARRGRRHHPVQLPGHGAAVDVRQRDRVRQRLRAQAEREGPVGLAAPRRAVAARPGCPTASSPWCRATRRRSTALLAHPDVAAVSFVGSTPIARHVYETGTAHGKRVQALGGAKNHMVVLPDADVDLAADAAVSAAYGSAGRAVHGDLGRRRGRGRRRPARRRDRRPAAQAARRRRRRPGLRHGPADHRRAPRPGGRSYVDAGRRRGRHGGRRRPRGRRARRRASSSAPRCSTTSPPT